VKALEDAQLIARVLSGETEAYGVLVGRYQEVLYRYAVGMVHDADTAADLVQDSLVKAYTRLSSCQDPARFGAWLYRILVNRCKDHLKSRRRHDVPLEEDTATAPESYGPAHTTDRSNLGRVVERALATLPEAQREAFLLKHLEGHSYEEMAEMLDVSVSALKMRVMRAREVLQGLLREVAD
jgi:RNA polymerase sigma-70 factor (ECF subfamily)